MNFDENSEEIEQKIADYKKKHYKSVFDRNGNEIDHFIEINPVILTNTFFKPIVSFDEKPNYTANQMAQSYEYYQELLTKINDEIGAFPSSLTLFCRFIGVTLNDFKEMKNNEDLHYVIQKIIDDVDETNISMAQTGVTKERSTLFKLKAQNEMVEKVQPKVNVNIKASIDDNRIKGNILEYKEFLNKRG